MNLNELERKIRYTFKDRKLLTTALTHRSFLNESHGKSKESYDRLEFLGDAILEAVSSDYLYKNYPLIDEGKMSKIRAVVVCEAGLFAIAEKIGLGEYIFMSKGEEMSGGKNKPSILSDVTEAVFAAVYLDSDFDTAQRFILYHLEDSIKNAVKNSDNNPDYKSRLHEYATSHGDKLNYVVIREDGPEHEKVFTVAINYNGKQEVTAQGLGKKKAEQQAAMLMLKKLNR
ncbi:MAG: ribonuclease III [Ruminococcaceae bacterium]|nr:ribonuclease III [Oscillospiraceae bacterium]